MTYRYTTRKTEPLCRKGTISAKIQNKISKIIVSFLVKTPITPNQVTIFRFIILIPLSALLLSRGNYLSALIGVFLYIVNNILDYVDGDLARIKKLSSSIGDLLEHTSDYLGENILFFGVIIGSYKILNNVNVLILGILTIIIINVTMIFSIYLDLDHQEEAIPSKILKNFGIDRIIMSIVNPDRQILKIIFFPIFLIVIGVILNQIFLSLCIITITSTIRLIMMFYTLYKGYKTGEI